MRLFRVALFVLTAALILGACSATDPGGSPAPRTVDLTMTEQGTFEPATLEVRRGETVLFRIRNVSNQPHEAYIGSEEEQRLHATEHAALPADEQSGTTHLGAGLHVAPFGTGELAVKFDTGDEWVIGCHYPGHYDAGMRTLVTVTD
jgi:uncharacterized cupredoxin-like copper-binding protein